jgi:hypothetical protein
MGREFGLAQSRLSKKIAAGRIHLWGRQPGSLQIKQISADLFRPSKYNVVVTLDGKLSTAEAHKQHEFEEEYKDDSKWHDIIFFEDEIREEWRAAGRAAAEPSPPVSDDLPLVVAIKERLNAGDRPGSNVEWLPWCHEIRRMCGKATDGAPDRGYGDRSIQDATRELLKQYK